MCLRVRARNNYKRTDQGHDIGFWLSPIKHFPTPPSQWPIFFVYPRYLACTLDYYMVKGKGFVTYNFFYPDRKTKIVNFFFIHLLPLHALLYPLFHRCRRNNRQRSVSLSFITFILDFYAPAVVYSCASSSLSITS